MTDKTLLTLKVSRRFRQLIKAYAAIYDLSVSEIIEELIEREYRAKIHTLSS